MMTKIIINNNNKDLVKLFKGGYRLNRDCLFYR